VSNFPAITGKHLIKILKKIGFEVVRSKGSHHFLQHSDGRGLLAQIMRDCEITPEDLKKTL
jgi:hypothetical protein